LPPGERFALLGCSYGGYLAAGLARRLPDRVLGLLTICAGMRARLQDRDLSGLTPPTPEAGWLRDVPRELHDFFTHEIGHQTAAVANRIARALALGGPSNDRYLADLRNRFRLADEDRPRTYPGPTTLLAGRKDRVAGYRDHFAAVARYPRGTYVAHADAGHFLPFEQPTFFASVTRSWLADCLSAA
ncbi:MAG: alpha/beta fold hydrolase, partial [Acidimicrobiales bacterium]